MKRIFYLTLIATIALTVFSCRQEEIPSDPDGSLSNQEEAAGQNQDEEPAVPDSDGNIVFNAVREDLQDSRSTIASGGAVSWESGDAITILWDGGRTTSTTTDSGASASFSATVDAEAAGGTYYSVYPSSVATELIAADELSVTVPSSQDGTFSSANINVAKTTSSTFSFKAVANVIKFTVSDANVTKMRIYSYDQTPLAGTCSVDVSGSVPAVSSYSSTSGEIDVTISGTGTYYAVVLPGTHAEGLLFAPETATNYKRAAYAEKSWTAARKSITDFGDVESHARDLYVSASGSGKGLAAASPMSPADFKILLEQPLVANPDPEGDPFVQDDDVALRHFRLLYGNTIHIQDDIAIDEIKVEYTGAISKPCVYTITGATASTAISATGANRLFRFSNNTDVTISGITLTGGSAENGGAIEIDNGSSGTATVSCSNVTFSSNTANNNGGAVSLTGRGKAASFIANACTFSGNSAGSRGGAAYQSAGNDSQAGNSISSFTDCTFTSNTATTNAGVMQVYRGTATFAGNNTFTSNTSATGGVFHVNGVGTLNVTGGTFGVNGDSSYASANQATGSGDGGAVLYYEAGSASFSESIFQYNQSAKNGGVVTSKGRGSCVFTNCNFNHNKATSNGGVVYVTNNGVLTLTDCIGKFNTCVSGGIAQVYKGTLTVNGGTYGQNKATGAGGAFYLNSSTAELNLSGAAVTDNISRDGSGSGSDSRESGGGICASNQSVANISDCYFYNNRAGNADNTDSKEYGGAICVNKSSVTATNCNFHGNKGNRGSAVFMTSNGGGLFKADHCSFHGNKQYSRGVCYILANNVAMFNQCSFYDQSLRASSDAWGEMIHGGNTNAVCVNNCSFYGTKTYTQKISGVNTNGDLLLTNNTVIGSYPSTSSGTVRVGVATKTVFVNNVIINANANNSSVFVTSVEPTSCHNNALGANCSFTPGSDNATAVAASSFSWTPVSGADNSLDLWKGWFTWSGSSQGATVTAITDAYAAFSVDASSYGGVLGSMTHVGNAFKTWLDSFSPAAYTVNQQGGARAANYWPGSYQN